MAKIDPKWSALLESLKEPGRLLLMALVSYLLTVVIPQVEAGWVLPITIVLRFVDKYLHEYGTATKNDALITGLTRF